MSAVENQPALTEDERQRLEICQVFTNLMANEAMVAILRRGRCISLLIHPNPILEENYDPKNPDDAEFLTWLRNRKPKDTGFRASLSWLDSPHTLTFEVDADMNMVKYTLSDTLTPAFEKP